MDRISRLEAKTLNLELPPKGVVKFSYLLSLHVALVADIDGICKPFLNRFFMKIILLTHI